MRDLLLVGGMGTGKTTLADAVRREIPDAHYMHLSRINALIPMTLRELCPHLLESTAAEYIDIIVKNQDIEPKIFSRKETDAYGIELAAQYGDTILAQVVLAARRPGVVNILDNVPGVSNVRLIKNAGAYTVGFYCPFEEQVRRRLKDRKSIDPDTIEGMRAQVASTNTYFDVEHTVPLADMKYCTDWCKPDNAVIVLETINAIKPV